MKKIILLLIVLSIILSVNIFSQTKSKKTQTTKTTSNKIYENKSGKLVYKMNFMGDQYYTLYWDDYGDKEAKIMKVDIEVFGQKSSSENVELKVDGYIYKFDRDKKEGTKSKAYSPLGTAKGVPSDISKMAQKEIEKMKLVDLGTKEILGKTCKGYQMEPMGMKMETWSWKNLLLESKTWMSKQGEPIEMNAISLELDIPIPEDIFKVPSDIKFTEY